MRLYAIELPNCAGDPSAIDAVSGRCWAAGAAGIWEHAASDGVVELRVGVEELDVDGFLSALGELRPRDATDELAVDLATRTVVVGGDDGALGLAEPLQLEVPPTVFGDGTHPTTAACLEILATTVRPDDRVLDVGCGSGALALLAASRGATVVAIDIDPAAVEATRANAAHNGLEVDARGQSLETVQGSFDLVVANISAGAMLALADDLLARLTPAGTVVLSGILEDRWSEVRTRFAGTVLVEHHRDGWVSAALTR